MKPLSISTVGNGRSLRVDPFRHLSLPRAFVTQKRCPNAAYVHVCCWRCCIRVHRVRVDASGIENGGLGLFAERDFDAGSYVSDYIFDIRPSKGGCDSFDMS
jgi:hypothetical protein